MIGAENRAGLPPAQCENGSQWQSMHEYVSAWFMKHVNKITAGRLLDRPPSKRLGAARFHRHNAKRHPPKRCDAMDGSFALNGGAAARQENSKRRAMHDLGSNTQTRPVLDDEADSPSCSTGGTTLGHTQPADTSILPTVEALEWAACVASGEGQVTRLDPDPATPHASAEEHCDSRSVEPVVSSSPSIPSSTMKQDTLIPREALSKLREQIRNIVFMRDKDPPRGKPHLLQATYSSEPAPAPANMGCSDRVESVDQRPRPQFDPRSPRPRRSMSTIGPCVAGIARQAAHVCLEPPEVEWEWKSGGQLVTMPMNDAVDKRPSPPGSPTWANLRNPGRQPDGAWSEHKQEEFAQKLESYTTSMDGRTLLARAVERKRAKLASFLKK